MKLHLKSLYLVLFLFLAASGYSGGTFPPMKVDFLESSWKAGQTYISQEDGLRLRSSYDLQAQVLGSLSTGENVTFLTEGPLALIDGREARWTQVKTSKGLQGWVFGGYLKPGALKPQSQEPFISFSSTTLGVSFKYPKSWGYCYAGRWTQWYGNSKTKQVDRLFFSQRKWEISDLSSIAMAYSGPDYGAQSPSIDLAVNLFSNPLYDSNAPREGLRFENTSDEKALRILKSMISQYRNASDQLRDISTDGGSRLSFYRFSDFDQVISTALSTKPSPGVYGFGPVFINKTFVILLGKKKPFGGLVIDAPLALNPDDFQRFEKAAVFFKFEGSETQRPIPERITSSRILYNKMAEELIQKDKNIAIKAPIMQEIEAFAASIKPIEDKQ